MNIWECEIGFAGNLPDNANKKLALAGMTRYVKRKVKELAGVQADFFFAEVDNQLSEERRQAAKVGNQALVVFRCKVGVKGNVTLPEGVGQLAVVMFSILFRKDAEFNFSGCNTSLTESELATLK